MACLPTCLLLAQGTTEGYLLDEICTANVLGGITGDGRALASEVVRVLMFE
jgi:hypothetical protein